MSVQVGFIGLGRMGLPIAARLRQAGYGIVALSRNLVAAQTLAAVTVDVPRKVAQQTQLVFTALPSPAASLDVYLGDDGLLSGAPPGTLLVELSTIDPGTAKKLGIACAARSVRFIDAPVSGGPKGAVSGTLTVMMGGDIEDVASAEPFIATFSTKRICLGSVGAGSAAKMCNQMLTGVTHLLVAEAMVLGSKAGLDPALLYEVLKASSGQSNSLERAVPNFFLPRKFEPAFALDGIYKDLECVTQTGKQLGVRLLLAAVAQQSYEEARALGLGSQDVASVLLAVERVSGTTVISDSFLRVTT